MKLSPFKIALLYLIVGICWIYFSDQAFLYLFHFTNPRVIAYFQTVKGTSYVIVTAGLLWLLIKNTYRDKLKMAEDYKKLFMNTPMSIWIYDIENYKILEINKMAESQYGYTREEFLSMNVLELRPAEERDRFIETTRLKEEKLKDWGVWTHCKKDGELMYMNMFSDQIEFKKRHCRMVFGMDITAKLKAEEQVALNEQKLSAIINSTEDLIWAVSTDLKYIAFNEAFRYIQLLTTGNKLLPGDDAILENYNMHSTHQWRDYYERAFQGEQFKTEITENLPEAGINYGEIIFNPIRGNKNKILGVACIARNITERKLHEIQLKEALEKYNILTTATNDAIWDWDIKSNKVMYNDNFWTRYHYPPSEQGKEFRESHIHPEDKERVLNGLQLKINNKENIWWDEYRFLCGDNTPKYVLDRAYIIYDEEQQQPVRIIGAMQDIQQQKIYEEAIEQQNKELREIAWSSSHELRGPVTAVMGLVELLMEEKNRSQEEEKILKMMKKSLDQLDEVLHKIVNKATVLER